MPARRATPRGYERARQLRKQSTPAEAKLWMILRGDQLKGVNFRRQHAIGEYIVDFCSPKRMLIIEVDGSPHTELRTRDATRTAFLEAEGYRVLRFWNSQVMNETDTVRQNILRALRLV